MLGGQISTTFDLRSGHVQECFLQEKRGIFDETLGQFPAVCDETKPGVLCKTFRQSKVMFVITKNCYLTRSWDNIQRCAWQQKPDISNNIKPKALFFS